ncbi:dehydrogenase [Flagelloscypha sp. PMI_526]|nr:dehydrogenase [Flagelloscypha sp. PMI_526]
MASYLVTGSSRGLGLGLVQQLVSKSASEVPHIFATAREAGDALSNIVAAHPERVHFVALDVVDSVSVQAAVNEVATILEAKNAVLDILVNNAGIGSMSPPRNFENVTDLEVTLKTNVLGAHLVTSSFLPLIRKSHVKKIFNVSTGGSSFGLSRPLYRAVPSHAYKVSKAALNMLTVQYALDLEDEGFCVIAFSPGWTQTDMGGGNAHLTVGQCAAGMFGMIQKVEKEDNGKFLNNSVAQEILGVDRNYYSGQEFPW